jgi:transcriptional regulator GlxA family with amidase domain
MTDTERPIRTALLLYDGCDLMDVGGPYEVLLTANRLRVRAGAPAPFEVRTVAASATVTAYGGLGLTASHRPAELDTIDLLVVPGLVDLDTALADQDLIARIAELASRAEVVASVCTGAFLLAAAGLLHGRPATTHHEDTALLRARDDVGEVVDGVRWVDDGDIVTAAGLSSGLALGLHLVERFASRDLANRTATQLEHDWDPNPARSVTNN